MGTIANLLNTAMRDFVRYSGDGLPNEPVNRPLPVGDPTSGEFNPSKKQVRDAFRGLADVADGVLEPTAEAIGAAEQARGDADQTALDRLAVAADVVAARQARDAAFLNAGVVGGYATTAEGLSVTSIGDAFTAPDGDEIQAYRHNAGPVATPIDGLRYPSALPVIVNSAWVDLPDTAADTIGSLAPTGTAYSNTRFVGPSESMPTDGIVQSLTVEVTSTLTAQIALMKPRRQSSGAVGTMDFETILIKSVSGLAVGTQTIDLGSISAPAGTRVLMRRSSGAIDADGTTAGSCEHNSATATVGEVKPLSMSVNRALAMQLSYIPLPLGTLARAALKSAEANKSGGDQKEDVGDQLGSLTPADSLDQRIEIAADVGLDIPSGSAIVGVTVALATSAAANKAETFVMAVYRRLTTDTDVDASTSTGTIEYLTSRQYSGAALGLVADGAEMDVFFDTDLIQIEDGYTYYASLSGLTAGGILGALSYGLDYARSALRQRRKGWNVSGTTVTNITTFSSQIVPASLRMGFVYQEPVALTVADNTPAAIHIDKITSANLAVDGLEVSTRLEYTRDNKRFKTDDVRTFTGSASGNVRFDLLYLDRSNLLDFTETPTFGVVSGTERTDDPGEFIPTLNDGLTYGQMPVAYLRVTDAAVKALPVWDVVNGDIEHLIPQIRLDRERNQRILRRALGRIRRGAPIKIPLISDSIGAVGNVSKAIGEVNPNGVSRDRGATQYYNDNIGSDLVSALPLFTSVQMGYADDGAGAVHTKTSFMWTFVAAVQEASGLALGASGVLYNNWGINSQKVENLYSGGAASSWLQNFCADGADLVVINMGMNDYILPQPLFGFTPNYVATVEYIQANCVDRDGNVPPIILMGVARPNSGIAAGFWNAVNRNIRTVAEATGCAFVDLMPYYDAPNLRSIGLTVDDTCSGNGTNHPGVYEQEKIIGRALVSLTLG